MSYSLKPDFRITQFLQVVDECRGSVFFKDIEGNLLDLKGQLCKYIFLTLRPGEAQLSDGKIICDEEDAKHLASYLIL